MKREALERILDARRRRQPVSVITEMASGRQSVIIGDDPADGDLHLTPEILAGVADFRRRDKSGMVISGDDDAKAADGGRIFVQTINPPLRLAIVGAVHIAQALVPMARLAGYDVTIIDPRGAFATAERFPGTTLDQRWPDEALADYRLDRRSSLVALTHDPKLDDPALTVALASDCFYVGALGSTRTHARRRDRLAEAGLEMQAIDRIHGPIGLSIGAVSPAEIAVSILAEMTATLRGSTLPKG